jgi:hypothetical protein
MVHSNGSSIHTAIVALSSSITVVGDMISFVGIVLEYPLLANDGYD